MSVNTGFSIDATLSQARTNLPEVAGRLSYVEILCLSGGCSIICRDEYLWDDAVERGIFIDLSVILERL